MKPCYADVIFSDFNSKYNNSKNHIVRLNKTYSDMDDGYAIADQGNTMIYVNCLAYEYVKDKLVDSYNVIEENEIVTRKIDYSRMLPITLCCYVGIISCDIDEISEFEEFYQNAYKDKVIYSIECMVDAQENISFEGSVIEHKRGEYKKRNLDNCTSKTMYVSQFTFKGENCISYVEKYSAAKIELVKGIKDEIIERLAALEDIKELLLQKDNGDSRIGDVENAWFDLNKLIDFTQGITTYHNLYETMSSNSCSPEEALDIIKNEQKKKVAEEREKKERELARQEELKRKAETEAKAMQSKVDKANTQYVKTGDASINRYTDFIANNIKSTLNEFGDFKIFAGSNFMEFYRIKVINTIEFPCIVIEDVSYFLTDINKYANLAESGNIVYRYHDYINSLPISYGIKVSIYMQDKKQYDEVKKRIADTYTNQVNVFIDDPNFQGEKNVINLQIDSMKEEKELIGEKTVYISQYIFKNTFSVYYAKDYEISEITNNPRLQYRLLQRAQYYLCCFTQVKDRAVRELESKYYELVMNKSTLFGMLDSANMKKLKQQFKYKQPISRDIFDLEFKNIVCVYPLYDKMMLGMTYEQLRNEIQGLIELYASKWLSICNMLSIPENVMSSIMKPFDNHSFNARSNEGLTQCITHMHNNPDATLEDAIQSFKSYLLKEYKNWQIKERERKAALESRQNYDVYDNPQYDNGGSGGGIIKGIIKDTAEYVGEKFKDKNTYPDLMGSAGCIIGKRSPGSNLRYTMCNVSCPFYHECARGFHRKL